MTLMQMYEEPFSPSGGSSASALLGALGSPPLEMVELAVREAGQNAWDARLKDDVSPSFLLDVRRLSEDVRTILRQEVFAGWAGASNADFGTMALMFSDRGTVGLAGPTKADDVQDGERVNYTNFWFKHGTHEDVRSGGAGSYGVGRTSLYRLSRVHAMLVYSRTFDRFGNPVSRLVASVLDPDLAKQNKKRTGRIWWGRLSDDFFAPLEGKAADDLAQRLGIGIQEDQTGSSMFVVDPVLPPLGIDDDVEDGGEDRSDPAVRLRDLAADAVVRHFWPKFQSRRQTRRMQIEVRLDGTAIDLQPLLDDPVMQQYRKALEAAEATLDGVDAPAGTRSYVLECRRPLRKLGVLGVVLCRAEDVEASLFADVVDRVVTMRQPRLVIEWRRIPVPRLRDDRRAFGVFVATDEMNDLLRRSEPPAHNEWVEQQIDVASDRTLVRSIGKRIEDRFRDLFVVAAQTDDSAGESTAGRLALDVAVRMAGLASIAPGLGLGGGGGKLVGKGGGGGGGNGGRNAAEPSAELRSTRIIARTASTCTHECRVQVVAGLEGSADRLEMSVSRSGVTDDGRTEKEWSRVTSVQWSRQGSPAAPTGTAAALAGEWVARVELPADCASALRFSLAKAAG